MEKTTLPVKGMSCDHCVAAVTKAISGIAGVKNVAVNLAKGNAVFEYSGTPADLAKIKGAIVDQGFDVP
jgi:copper chaperone